MERTGIAGPHQSHSYTAQDQLGQLSDFARLLRHSSGWRLLSSSPPPLLTGFTWSICQDVPADPPYFDHSMVDPHTSCLATAASLPFITFPLRHTANFVDSVQEPPFRSLFCFRIYLPFRLTFKCERLTIPIGGSSKPSP